MAKQHCPICSSEVAPNPRYPRYVCQACAARAVSADGRRVVFYNEGISGGCVGEYAESGAEYPARECFIDGVACRADEAHFGGIVIETAG